MQFEADKTKKLIITVTLQPDAMGAIGHFKLVREIGGARTLIRDSGPGGHSSYAFSFKPAELNAWEPVNLLEFDVFATFVGATEADVLIDVKQIDPQSDVSTVCPNQDAVPPGKPSDYRSTDNTGNAFVPSGTFTILL